MKSLQVTLFFFVTATIARAEAASGTGTFTGTFQCSNITCADSAIYTTPVILTTTGNYFIAGPTSANLPGYCTTHGGVVAMSCVVTGTRYNWVDTKSSSLDKP